MLRARPGGVILCCDSVGVLEPFARFAAAGRSCGEACRVFVDGADHGCQKRRLRAREVVSAVSVEDGAVVLDFKEEVIDDPLGERLVMVGFQSKKNEKTIPAIHFVEAAAGNDVGMRKVEQAGGSEFFGADVAEFLDAPRQSDDLDLALLLERGDVGWSGHACGQIQDRDGRDFGIDFCVGERTAIGDGASERVPCGMDVAERGLRIGCCGRRRLGGGRCKRSEKEKTRKLHEGSGRVRTPGVYRNEQISCAMREQFAEVRCQYKHSGTEWDERRAVKTELLPR